MDNKMMAMMSINTKENNNKVYDVLDGDHIYPMTTKQIMELKKILAKSGICTIKYNFRNFAKFMVCFK